METQWVVLHIKNYKETCFNCFGVEHIPKEIKLFVGDKYTVSIVCRMRAYDSMICGDFCIGFIYFVLNNEGLLYSASLFFIYCFLKNNKMI